MRGLSWEDDGHQEVLLTRRSAQRCLSQREIEEFLFSRLSGVTREVVEEHLMGCPNCVEAIEREEEFIDAARSAAREIEAQSLLHAQNREPTTGGPGLFGGFLGRLVGAWARPMGLAFAGVAALALLLVVVPRNTAPIAEVSVLLQAERGELSGSVAPAGTRLLLSADLAGLPALPRYRMELVSAEGDTVKTTEAQPERGRLLWHLGQPGTAGQYWVRVSNPATQNDLLREYALHIR